MTDYYGNIDIGQVWKRKSDGSQHRINSSIVRYIRGKWVNQVIFESNETVSWADLTRDWEYVETRPLPKPLLKVGT